MPFYFSVYGTKFSTLDCVIVGALCAFVTDDDDDDDSNKYIDVMRITYSNFPYHKKRNIATHAPTDCEQNANYYCYYALQ